MALYGDSVAQPQIEKSNKTNESIDNPDLESNSSEDEESNKEDFDSAEIQEFECQMAGTYNEVDTNSILKPLRIR